MEWFEISGIVLLSSFKYIFGVGLAMFTYANDPLKGFIITTFGGILVCNFPRHPRWNGISREMEKVNVTLENK